MADLIELSEADYHASTGYGDGLWLSRSSIQRYIDDRRGFRLAFVEKHPRMAMGETASMRLGSAFDCLITDGAAAFHAIYTVVPEGDPIPEYWLTPSGGLSTRAEVREEIEQCCQDGVVIRGVSKTVQSWTDAATARGLTVISREEYERAQFLSDMLLEHPLAQWLCTNYTHSQPTYRWTDPATGLRIQTRPDLLVDGKALVDVKTIAENPSRGFLRSVMRYGYHLQAAMAIDAERGRSGRTLPFFFAVQQSQPPYRSDVIQLPEGLIEHGRAQMRRALDGICAQDWYLTDTNATTPILPLWLLQEMDLEEDAAGAPGSDSES